MIRTQVQLTDGQARALKQLATQQGVSMAEVIRGSVEHTIQREREDETWRLALSLLGKFRSDHSDVSTKHDQYLAEDFR